MNAVWQVQDAKNRLSEVIDKAVREGPQTVTRHGRPVVTIAAFQDAATGGVSKPDGFADFLLSMPKAGLTDGLPAMLRRNRRRAITLGD